MQPTGALCSTVFAFPATGISLGVAVIKKLDDSATQLQARDIFEITRGGNLFGNSQCGHFGFLQSSLGKSGAVRSVRRKALSGSLTTFGGVSFVSQACSPCQFPQ